MFDKQYAIDNPNDHVELKSGSVPLMKFIDDGCIVLDNDGNEYYLDLNEVIYDDPESLILYRGDTIVMTHYTEKEFWTEMFEGMDINDIPENL